jgi:prepilin-type N-terminal cleavage/methylation domain-containing protein
MPKLVEKRISSAFTLIELTLVVVLVLILASLALVKFGPVSEKARSAEAYSALAQIASAENVYELENNTYITCTDCASVLDVDLPSSENFDFSVPAAITYAKATKKPNRGTKDYCMNLNGGGKITCP